MNTIRLTVTPDLKRELDFVRAIEYPALTDAEILKVAFVEKAARTRRKARLDVNVDYSDPTPDELMLQAGYVFGLDEEDGDIPEVDLSRLKPLKIK